MGDLELVARVDNRLLLRDEAGAEYRLPICPKLKSMVYAGQSTPQYPTVSTPIPLVGPGGRKGTSGDVADVKGVKAEAKTAKIAVLAVGADGEPLPRLRPAELQIRLRAGDTPEQLAEFSELTAEQIAKFAGPIEAERADVIRAMRRMRVAGDVHHTIGDLVSQRLGARGVNSEQMAWQARRDIGTPWLIELRYEDGGRTHSARWTFEYQRHLLTALDDEARWLSSAEAPVVETTPITLHQAKRPTPVRPASDGGRPTTLRGNRPLERHASVFHDGGPQVSGAPLVMPNDGEATVAVGRPDLRPVAGLHPDAPTPKLKPELPEADMVGIVPINHWKAEKLETVAMPVAAEVVETPAKRGNAIADALNLNPRPAGKEAPADLLFESTATGSNPVIGRKGRASVPSLDQILFGAKE